MSAVYLITLSQAGGTVASKKDFGEAIARAFQHLYGNGSVMYWAACEERHQDGGVHYHASIKLSRPQRFSRARAHLDEQHGMNVNFAAGQGGYFGAYSYIVKEDPEPFHSERHPAELEAPRTQVALQARQRRAAERRAAESSTHSQQAEAEEAAEAEEEEAKLTKVDVARLIVDEEVSTMRDMLALAETKKREGDESLYKFIINRGRRQIEELIGLSREMDTSVEQQAYSQMSRMDKLAGMLTHYYAL